MVGIVMTLYPLGARRHEAWDGGNPLADHLLSVWVVQIVCIEKEGSTVDDSSS